MGTQEKGREGVPRGSFPDSAPFLLLFHYASTLEDVNSKCETGSDGPDGHKRLFTVGKVRLAKGCHRGFAVKFFIG